MIDSVTTLNSSTLLNMRASLSYWRELIGPPDFGFDATQWGWPASTVAQLTKRNLLPSISVAGATTLGNASSNITFEPTTVLSLQPNVVMVRGKQTIKAGLDYRLTRYTQYRPSADRASLSFDQGFTRSDYLTQDALSGNGAASLLLGYAGSGSAGFTANPFFQWIYTAPWVQDDIKLTRKLALNFGLRWDITSPVTERYNRLNRDFFADQVNPISSKIDQTKFPGMKAYGGIGFAGQGGLSRSPFNSDWNNFQPRIGAAYQLNSKTVLRGGWAIFYLAPTDSGLTSGFSQNTPYVATQDSGRTPFSTISNPFPTGLIQPSGADGRDGHVYRTGRYVRQYEEQESLCSPVLVRDSAGTARTRQRRCVLCRLADDVGAGEQFHQFPLCREPGAGRPQQGRRPELPQSAVAESLPGFAARHHHQRPDRGAQPVAAAVPGVHRRHRHQSERGKIWYNSLQVSVQKRYSHGLTFSANYTLSKNIQATSYVNAQDAAPTRVLTAFDRPQRLAFSPSYELPFGPGRRFLSSSNGVVKRLVGGWQVLANTVFQSGAPMGVPSSV